MIFNMLYSYSKTEDQKLRVLHLGVLEGALKRYRETGKKEHLELAKEVGKQCEELRHKIETKDYSREDALFASLLHATPLQV